MFGCAYGTWAVNAPKTDTPGGWALLALLEAFFLGVGLLAVGFRMSFTVLPAERRAERRSAFLGVAFSDKTWSFADIAGVDLRVTAGAKGSRSAALRLLLRSGGEPVVVNTYMMPGGVPDSALADARELSGLIGVPLKLPRA